MRIFDAIPRWAAMLIVFAGLQALHAQAIPPPQNQTRPPAMPGSSPHSSDDEEDGATRQMAAAQATKRNTQRQQQLVDDTAKLLTLAQQLKEEVDKSTKDTLSIAVVKKAEEIEKLAKSVKEKMREAQ
jgi:type VI protein secretion system component VasF